MKDRFALAILLSIALHLLLIEIVSALDFLWPAARHASERQIIAVSLVEMDNSANPLGRREGNERYSPESSSLDRTRAETHARPVATSPRQAVTRLQAGRRGAVAVPAGEISRPAAVAPCAEPTDRPLPVAENRQAQEETLTVAVTAPPADFPQPAGSLLPQDAGRCVTAAGAGAAGSGAGSSAPGSAEGEDEGQGGQGNGKSGRGSIQVPGEFLAGNAPPRYPLLAQRKGWEGKVIIDIRIAGDGRVQEAQIEKSSGYTILDEAALGAIRNWRIAPNGRVDEVNFKFRVPVIFKLTQS